MAKKKTPKYIKSPSASGDLWIDKKYDLTSDLSQEDLKRIYDAGFVNVVYKTEG